MMISLKKDLLGIKIFKTREEMGEAALDFGKDSPKIDFWVLRVD